MTDKTKGDGSPETDAIVADAFHALGYPLLLLDAELRFVFANACWLDSFLPSARPEPGLPAGELFQRVFAGCDPERPERPTIGARVVDLVRAMKDEAEDIAFQTAAGTPMTASVYRPPQGGYLISFKDSTDRQEIERLRLKSEQANLRLRDALESIGECFALFDKEDKLILANEKYKSANPAAAHVMTVGQPRQNIIAAMMNGGDILGIGDWVESYSDESRLGDTTSSRTYEIRHRSGRVYLASRSPTEEGGCAITWLDITERKRAEQTASDTLNDAIESLDEGFALWDPNLDYVLSNRKFLELVLPNGTAPEVGTSAAELVRLCVASGNYEIAEDKTAQEYATEIVGAIHAFAKGILLKRSDGVRIEMSAHKTQLSGYLLTVLDVTERMRGEEAKREADLLVKTIVDSSPTTFLVSRVSDGKVLYCPPASRDRFGDIQSTLSFFLSPEDRKEYLAALSKTGLLNDYPVKFRRGDGTIMDGLTSARMIDYRGENIIVSSTRDITEQLAMQAELEHQREVAHQNEKLSALGELLAGVAHELNNPLSVVVGYAMMLQSKIDDPTLNRQITNVAQAAERCARIVKAFLAMARQRPIELVPCSLNELILAALDMVGDRLREAGIEVQLDLEPGLPDVEADEDQIIQVFTNLIINAEQALASIDGPRRLLLQSFTSPEQTSAVMRVSDNGPGIAPADRNRVFEPFYTTKDVGEGTGIGLAFSHRVITSHGGQLTVDSSNEDGGGAQFLVSLGVVDHDKMAATNGPLDKEDVCGRILVVDDEPGVAELIGEVLTEAGFEVSIENSAKRALDQIRTRPFDAVLSDIRMPEMDGPSFYDALRAINPGLAGRSAFITGDTLSRPVADFLHETSQPHLKKPVTPAELLELVADLLLVPEGMS